MKLLKFFIGLGLGILLMVIPLSQFQPSLLEPLQTLAVQLDGRKKPLDTVARETVTQIHGRTNYRPANGKTLDYFHTYLSMWSNDRDWHKEPFILFSYRPLKERVGLNLEQKYFSYQELVDSSIGDIVVQARQKQAQNFPLTRNEREALTLDNRVSLMLTTVGNEDLPIVPHPADKKGTWVGIRQGEKYYQPEAFAPVIEEYEDLKQAYTLEPEKLAKLSEIGRNLHDRLQNLSPRIYPNLAALQREVDFSAFHPFGKAWKLYAIALVAMLLVLWWEKFDFYWGALGIFVAGVLLEGYGFIIRMQIAERPPVTNMYESVIWVSFGLAAAAVAFELITRARYYLLSAAPLAVVCLLLADNLPAVLDSSIKPLVPVLRDNFWLSIHVPTITLSYATFALAMGLGHIALGHYLFAPQASQRIAKLSQLNYRVLQIGVLLLTTGVILGGIWAHFSWGRFWGWDPKETWAAIALLSYLLPLHGRLVGWLSDFGMAVASVVCFNAVLMAWYGVNFVLGTGLHSYGFSTGGSSAIVATLVGVDLLFVLAATARHKGWFKVRPAVGAKKSEESVSEVSLEQS